VFASRHPDHVVRVVAPSAVCGADAGTQSASSPAPSGL